MRGIDISSWQGSVDFNKVKADGIEFCILREGFRKTIDSRFKEYVSGCKSAGIPVLGCYHFIYWNGATIKENAVSMVNNMKLAGLDPFNTWLFADLEYDSWTKAGEKVSKSRCSSLTKEFLDELKKLGCTKLAIYCNQDYYRNYLDWNVLSDYRDHLWLADYEGEPGYTCSIQQTGSTGKVNGISGNVDTDTLFDKSMVKGVEKMACTREHFVETAKKYLGYNEDDNSHMEILNIYNNGLEKAVAKWGTRNVKMWSTAHWCSCYVSAMAMVAGCDDIVPIEISCYYHRVIAERNGIWVESDAYVPQPGDLVIYDWDDSGFGDNRGLEDHIGIVISCDGASFQTIEGNTSGHGSGESYKGKVAIHTRSVNQRYIRGFIVPKGWADDKETQVAPKEPKDIEEVIRIANEVWDGKWGNGEDRKRRLEQSGYNYAVIQAMVNSMAKGMVWKTHPEVKKTYAVVKGDTMYKIAKENGLTLAELILKNPQIKNPNLIYVGDIINL